MKTTLYQQSSTGKTKQWSIETTGDGAYTITWGLVGGKQQSTERIAKRDTGWTRDEHLKRATEEVAKLIKGKMDEGYCTMCNQPKIKTHYDPLSGLTKSFVPAKPVATMTLNDLIEFDARGELMIQRKRDGQRHFALITRSGQVKLYSRRMENMTYNFPALVEILGEQGLPKGTILDGEVIVDVNGADDFRAVGTIARSKPLKAAAAEKKLPVRFMVFDALWFDGEPLWKKPYKERYAVLKPLFKGWSVFLAPLLGKTYKVGLRELYQDCVDRKWEGLVCWFANEPTLVREGGKPKRCGCAKLKPVKEQDFVCTGFDKGEGAFMHVVGSLRLSEYMPDGSMRDCGSAGSGLTFEDRQDALAWDYPCVVSIRFDKQEPEGTLRFPVFVKKHEDKMPHECIAATEEEED